MVVPAWERIVGALGSPPVAARPAQQWYMLRPSDARFCVLGEVIEAGDILGASWCNGQALVVNARGRVSAMQFDLWEDQLVIVLENVDSGQTL